MKDPEPDAFWISVDPEIPVAMWNKELGTYTSAGWTYASVDSAFARDYISGAADYCLLMPNPHASGALSMYQVTLTAPYIVEYNAELARRRIDPLLPSRFSAIFACGTKQDAVKAARAAGRPCYEVHPFRLQRDSLTRVHRANMNVITLMRQAGRLSTTDAATNEVVWRHYWEGGGELELELPSAPGFASKTHKSGVLWEYLIEGKLDLIPGRRH